MGSSAKETRRRTFLRGLGGAIAVSTVAGCFDDEGEPAEESEPEPVVDEATATEGPTDPDSWRDIDRIRFDGYVGGWVGVEPDHVDRVENPTLVLVAGREYELTWRNRDGMHHNVAFWDADRNVVRDYSTDGTDVEDDIETLAFEATTEMETYRCEYQPEGQWGHVEVVDAG
ncbi:hypothetical protein [Halobiforma nitratireducens]|uniref:Blue (Type 1) copper domain-containing protein n=1 Tax=Halobiforma nitratireducens JCM 10879 TaxID=1227454 RepID=M0M4W8_9EURY|nr:hypothetical protein [Halobiforma nitratireducens]EMA40857.1 hypothetical protein C446_06760 [Halobiforma nitratireducens JCM 10879]